MSARHQFFHRRCRNVCRRHRHRDADAARVGEAVMSVISAILIGLAMGLVFGFALEKSRVFEPGIILGQMQLRNFTMLKVFLSAVATGLVVLAALNGFGVVSLSPQATLFAVEVGGGLQNGRT